MGKEETSESAKEDAEAITNSKEATPDVKVESENTDKQPEEKSETKVENTSDNKKDVESLRTVIKVKEGETPTEEKVEESPVPEEKNKETKEKSETTENKIPKTGQTKDTPSGDSRDDLELKRNMLQSIKDFDYQIKKNQEEVGNLTEKVDSVVKDLDDLVSLYEIVSEQMNPFVGLSKVTKKRIDALENFTKQMEEIENRMDDIESVLEQNKGTLGALAISTKKLHDTKAKNVAIADKKQAEEDAKKTQETKEDIDEKTIESAEKTEEEEVPKEDTTGETKEKLEPEIEKTNIEHEITPIEKNLEPEKVINNEVSESMTINSTPIGKESYSDEDLDLILSRSLEVLFAEQNIENLITEFLLNLK